MQSMVGSAVAPSSANPALRRRSQPQKKSAPSPHALVRHKRNNEMQEMKCNMQQTAGQTGVKTVRQQLDPPAGTALSAVGCKQQPPPVLSQFKEELDVDGGRYNL